MSTPMGMILIWEQGALDPSRVEEILARAMSVPAPLARLSASSGVEVLDASQWLSDGTIAMFTNPMGFDIARIQWSPNVLCVSDVLTDARMASIKGLLGAALDAWRPRFGYVTHYSNQLEAPWLEQRVLVPLLSEAWDELVSSLYHCVIIPADLRVTPPEHARPIHT